MNQAALITGATDRIGKGIALKLAELGIDIALHFNNSAQKAIQTRDEVISKNVKCEIFKADFNNSQDAAKLISDITRFFNISILINNASCFTESRLVENNYSLFEKLFNINFKTPYILTKEFAAKTKNGLIINFLDAKITKNSTGHFDYLLTKKFLEVFTKMSAVELAPGIRVNGIAPGLILPPEGKGQDYLTGLTQNIPLKSAGSIKNINDTVEFILKNEYITGQVIFVDGGDNL